MTMMNSLVRPIAFNTFSPLDMTYSSCVILFSAILTLWDFWIHIYFMYYSNKAFCIEVFVDDHFHIGTILHIPYVDPYYGYVWFWRNLYNSWFRYKNNTIKNVIIFENFFDFIRQNSHIWMFANIWNTYNLEI